MPLEFKDVTVVCKGGFLGLSVVYCKELSIEFKAYAQYSRATGVRYKEPKQRKFRGTVLGYDQELAVFDGKVEYDNFSPEKVSESGVVTRQSKFSSCADEWDTELGNLIEQHKDRLLYSQDKSGKERSGP